MSKELREKYLPPAILHDNLLNEEEKLIQIMTNSDLNQTAKFIFLAFEHRDITLEVLNTLHDLTEFVENNTQNASNNCPETQVVSNGHKTPSIEGSNKSYKIKTVSQDGLKLLLTRIDAHS